jgi:hypothetical protein
MRDAVLPRRVLFIIPSGTLDFGNNRFSGTLAADLFHRLDKLGKPNTNPVCRRLHSYGKAKQSAAHTPNNYQCACTPHATQMHIHKVELDLHNCSFTGTLPASISEMPKLGT